jgi:mRNA-degrading endonuclease RelE of RelBE toxin-antitoxin system
MPKIRTSERFINNYQKLPADIKVKVKKALPFLAEDVRYPSLHTKPIEGAPGIYEARVDQNYRLTYQRLPGDVLLLRVVGKHDDALKNP